MPAPRLADSQISAGRLAANGPISPAVRVTTAKRSRISEQQRRMKRYLWMMAIRLSCFALIFVTPDPWRWAWALGAVVLPYIAVVIANAGGEAHPGSLDAVAPVPLEVLAPEPTTGPANQPTGATTDSVVIGQVLEVRHHGDLNDTPPSERDAS